MDPLRPGVCFPVRHPLSNMQNDFGNYVIMLLLIKRFRAIRWGSPASPAFGRSVSLPNEAWLTKQPRPWVRAASITGERAGLALICRPSDKTDRRNTWRAQLKPFTLS